MRRLASAVVLALVACGTSGDGNGEGTNAPGSSRNEEPGSVVATKLSAAQQAELDAIQAQLAEVKGLDAAGFEKKYGVQWTTSLGYDPLTAKGLDLVDASSALGLDADEKAKLATNGFVISERKRFPSFIYGYQTIYDADLPVYVSADSILYAVHRSYDRILAAEEEAVLAPALAVMLRQMRDLLATGALSGFSAETTQDVALYLAVAYGLLTGSIDTQVAGAKELVDMAVAHQGQRTVRLFGADREEDFSQFTPRGHYASSPTLTRYFQAMMWLGRIDLRILETQPDGSQIFRRRQLDAAYALRAVMSPSALEQWNRVEDVVAAFVGEADNITPPELDGLLADLGLSSALDLGKKTDAEIAQAVVNGAYGTQRISSHIMAGGVAGATLPLSSTFLLFGQRYVIDSHVFSNVVYDRVNHGGPLRMMPDPLDVAFAALRNDHAGLLLGQELQKYSYAPDLASMRIVVEAHPQDFWDANLYHQWVGALRGLSEKNTPGLPTIANTEAWGRRILNAQLASWAELRHDTLLYAKQSYTGVPSCEYPDAYVDPYPEVFARVAAFAARGAALPISPSARAYFTQLGTVASTLEAMAKAQRTGAPHSSEHMAFINQLNFSEGCGSPSFDGWYAKMFYDPNDAITQTKYTVADVHTQPADEGGNTVGRVLHVGTGSARAMVVTVDSCNGPRAYVGLASSYFEHTTSGYERLTDESWAGMLSPTPPDVPWMTSLVVR
jgi:hypothetical protein